MIQHGAWMTGRLVLPLRLPAERDQVGPAPIAVPLLRAATGWMDQAGCARPEVSGLPWIADSDRVDGPGRVRAAGGVGIAVDR
jgi:hypothetical protein